jgi:hypothetical protein
LVWNHFLCSFFYLFPCFGPPRRFWVSGQKKFYAILCHFLASITYCMNIWIHIFLISCIPTPFWTVFLLLRSEHRWKFKQ